jgi:hypothetical protein
MSGIEEQGCCVGRSVDAAGDDRGAAGGKTPGCCQANPGRSRHQSYLAVEILLFGTPLFAVRSRLFRQELPGEIEMAAHQIGIRHPVA